MFVSLVVPAHNEVGNLERLVDSVTSELSPPRFDHELEILLVDDNSTDETPGLCDQLEREYSSVTVVHRHDNPGFGNAVKEGLSAASGDIIIPFMGDLSDSPSDVPKLVEAIEDGYDVAYGSRFTEGGSVDGYPPVKLLYNRSFNNLIRLLFGIRSKDVTNAFTAYRREVIEEIGVETLDSDSFDITAELPLRAHILGFTSTEVPVTWQSRDAGVSKLDATRKGPVYLKRLSDLFVTGNLVGLRDLLSAITSGGPLRIVGAAVFGIAILVGLFSLTGFEGVFQTLSDAQPAWILGAAGMYGSTFAFRTWRFRVLLRTAGHMASRGGVLRSIFTGWFVNFLIPARAGDVARGLALKSTEDVPFGVTSGLVVVERILDMLMLGLLMGVVTLMFLSNSQGRFLALAAFGLALVLLVGLVVLVQLDERIADRFESRFPRIREGLAGLRHAVGSLLDNPYALALSLFLSLPVWLLEASTLFLSARALGVSLDLIVGLTASVAAFLTQAVPVTPGGLGTYEAAIAGVLSLFSISTTLGTSIGLIDHFMRLAFVYILGAISTVHIGFRSRSYFRDRSTQDSSSSNANSKSFTNK
ncbi:flippase-like domain-containing protein [Halogeometricum borinquense]|uniref:flippase-like domain-containing protein n=1 Tax=Halogeometricum borinquense TaxID=60847 RepID=UPI00344A3002